jgi:hypothetical protein
MVESHLHMLSETKEVGEPDACRAGAWQRDCRLIGWRGSGVPHLFVAVIAAQVPICQQVPTPKAGTESVCVPYPCARRKCRDGYIVKLRLYLANVFPQTS